MESDIRLLVLARFDDQAAVVQLWNRYYPAAFMAAAATASRHEHPAHVVATTFRHWMAHAEKQQTRISTFLGGWFNDIGSSQPPDAAQKAVCWAFYSMDQVNRTIVWRSHVDGWSVGQLSQELGFLPDFAASRIERADAQFIDFVERAAILLDVAPDPGRTDPSWSRGALIQGLLGCTEEVFDDRGVPLDSRQVITPPPPQQSAPFRFAATSLRTVGGSMQNGWRGMSTPVRVGAVTIVAAALAMGGILGASALNQPPPDSFPSPSATTRTPAPTPTRTPTHTVTPTPTPTDEATPTQDAAETEQPPAEQPVYYVPPNPAPPRPVQTTQAPPTAQPVHPPVTQPATPPPAPTTPPTVAPTTPPTVPPTTPPVTTQPPTPPTESPTSPEPTFVFTDIFPSTGFYYSAGADSGDGGYDDQLPIP
ncbi:MAG: hypothetical protein FWD75_00130 [Propionibacteriaceae bacterium]|nr:hypothetical protein [Propionibacteriaceae bacterium]